MYIYIYIYTYNYINYIILHIAISYHHTSPRGVAGRHLPAVPARRPPRPQHGRQP